MKRFALILCAVLGMTLSQTMAYAGDGGLDATATVQAKLGDAATQMESAMSLQTDYQSFAQTLGPNLTRVDLAAITAQMM